MFSNIAKGTPLGSENDFPQLELLKKVFLAKIFKKSTKQKNSKKVLFVRKTNWLIEGIPKTKEAFCGMVFTKVFITLQLT